MKNYNIQIPDIKLNLRKNGRILGIGSSAKFDWKFIFTLSSFLLVVMICFSVYMFLSVGSSDTGTATIKPPTATLTADMLTQTISYYDSKAMRLASITPETETIPDPSI
jgi:hypothetical protein